MKISKELKRAVRAEMARKGGLARAKKYDTKTLSAWGKKGGRPRKDGGK